MSVIVKVIGSKPNSDEYKGALKLKEILDEGLPKSALGEIILHANATLVGQQVKDIDLLMMGTLQNYNVSLSVKNITGDISTENVEICSFCTTIEIKSHGPEGVFREGTELYVKYGDRCHSVTTQSNEQKNSAFNFFNRMLNFSPFITNVIWFTGLTRNELKSILKVDSGNMPSLALSSDFSCKELMQVLVLQNQPKRYNGTYHFNCIYDNRPVSELQSAFNSFAAAKGAMGELTRKRIETLTNNAVSSNLVLENDGKLLIYRGRAGTGKTVGLIQTAINLVDENDARVLLLTYNKALVSDIRRLLALADLPDMFQESCLGITTMQSFFFRIINNGLYDGKLTGDRYISNYDNLLEELKSFLETDSDAKDILIESMGKDTFLDWDYCLVDEAQDWTESEKDLLLQLFEYNKVIVADGGQQFVRNIKSCDWTSVKERKPKKLKYCLRQKNNIIKFINHYLNALGKSDQKILSGDKLPGGKIIISDSDNYNLQLIKDELVNIKKTGNIPYDLIAFVPSYMVDKNPRHFKAKKVFEDNDIFIWDGTNEEIRDSYSVFGDDIRVLQYDSGRGLEAWSVICIEFDAFLEEKLSLYDDSLFENPLLLESEEERKLKYLVNWALIPLTRAIDTIVITLKNPESETSRILKQIAFENPDYINIK